MIGWKDRKRIRNSIRAGCRTEAWVCRSPGWSRI